MLSTPRRAALHHQSPCGSSRVIASASSPAGRARISPANNGCPGGSSSVVTTYVVPQDAGASAVSATVAARCACEGGGGLDDRSVMAFM